MCVLYGAQLKQPVETFEPMAALASTVDGAKG